MASTGKASSDFPGLLLQGLPQVFLTPWSVFVLERQDWPRAKWAGAWGLLGAHLAPSRCSAIPHLCSLPGSRLVGVTLFEVSGSSGTWDYQWESFPPPHHLHLLFSWFSFCSISHICALLSIPFSTCLIRKMLCFFGIVKFMKCSTYIIPLNSNKFTSS